MAYHVACWESQNNAVAKRKIAARYSSACGACDSPIQVGDIMTWNNKSISKVDNVEQPSYNSSEDMPPKRKTVTTASDGSLGDVLFTAIEGKIDSKIETKFEECIAEIHEHMPKTSLIEVKSPAAIDPVKVGRQHKLFATLLAMVSTGLNVWIAGPAGSGKTTAAKNVAKALSKPFYYTGAVSDPFALLGFRNALGETVRTQFREAFETGGVFLFDEIDASDANALAALHAAIENGVCAFPDVTVDRHADFVLIASANTYGHGGTHDYVGRNKLDGATLDRYIVLEWTYDEELERDTAPNLVWTKKVQRIRANVKAKGIKVLVTPRASYQGGALLAAGIAEDVVEHATIRKSMSEAQWNSVCN